MCKNLRIQSISEHFNFLWKHYLIEAIMEASMRNNNFPLWNWIVSIYMPTNSEATWTTPKHYTWMESLQCCTSYCFLYTLMMCCSKEMCILKHIQRKLRVCDFSTSFMQFHTFDVQRHTVCSLQIEAFNVCVGARSNLH